LKTLKSIGKLAVDANPMLSAIIGGKARDVFQFFQSIAFYTTEFNFKEVEKYIPVLSEKRELPLDDLYLALSMLPVSICNQEFYSAKLKQAGKLIGERDVSDIHLLALSLAFGCPVWSNDKDFDGLGIEVFTTLDLIKRL
jgi:predicted nucleic acid-binding protein